ncbi:hypothetical protein L1987_85016 [Smallanthus sonchifolius]|uniref:Uncharacterized protein n=1 Tax=Smallanthus sonchifolius TaxID=185202 RepID=A0ACB8XWE4_9ASTR|nr:hypothetical protein L1987_85016 [Smallanthus sonchifolius]
MSSKKTSFLVVLASIVVLGALTHVNAYSNRKPNCNSPGSACYDPRFIGGDGIVFYFHGKVNQHFTLISDSNLQINGPAGRSRDFTWIQALGLLFNSHTFSLEATKSATWDTGIDHLKFSYDGEHISLPVGGLSTWKSRDEEIKVERTSGVNSVMVTVPGVVEILANVVPVTAVDDRIHGYNVPVDDCFAHLEVQFRFAGLSDGVEGVLGRTYQPDFKNPAKPGINGVGKEKEMVTLDCTAKGLFHGNGIVCKK